MRLRTQAEMLGQYNCCCYQKRKHFLLLPAILPTSLTQTYCTSPTLTELIKQN